MDAISAGGYLLRVGVPKGEVVLAGWILESKMSRYNIGDGFSFKLFGFAIQLEAIRIFMHQLVGDLVDEGLRNLVLKLVRVETQ